MTAESFRLTFCRDLETAAREVEAYASDESLWARIPGLGLSLRDAIATAAETRGFRRARIDPLGVCLGKPVIDMNGFSPRVIARPIAYRYQTRP